MAIKTETKILLVQNEAMIRACLNDKLKSAGYKCDEAANADQALYKLENSEFDLVYLDIELQGVSAVELLPKIKADYPDTAIIVATPIGCSYIGIECIKLGAHEYMTKPLITEEVVRVIGTVLGKRRLELINKGLLKYLQDKITEQANELENIFFNALVSLTYALEAKYTKGHSQRVTALSVAIAKEMRLFQSDIVKITMAAEVHDIGKIGVSESILNKPDRLTPEEYLHIQEHSVIGERILTPIINDKETLSLIRNHHERCDGSGYPDQLGYAQMSVGSRIISVADAYDAMTSNRAYRTALNNEVAFDELKRCIGTQFDSDVVNAICHLELKNTGGGDMHFRVLSIQGEAK